MWKVTKSLDTDLGTNTLFSGIANDTVNLFGLLLNLMGNDSYTTTACEDEILMTRENDMGFTMTIFAYKES